MLLFFIKWNTECFTSDLTIGEIFFRYLLDMNTSIRATELGFVTISIMMKVFSAEWGQLVFYNSILSSCMSLKIILLPHVTLRNGTLLSQEENKKEIIWFMFHTEHLPLNFYRFCCLISEISKIKSRMLLCAEAFVLENWNFQCSPFNHRQWSLFRNSYGFSSIFISFFLSFEIRFWCANKCNSTYVYKISIKRE